MPVIDLDVGTIYTSMIDDWPEVQDELQWHPYGTIYRRMEGWPTRDAACPEEEC